MLWSVLECDSVISITLSKSMCHLLAKQQQYNCHCQSFPLPFVKDAWQVTPYNYPRPTRN